MAFLARSNHPTPTTTQKERQAMLCVKRYDIRRNADWAFWRGEERPSRQLFTIKEPLADGLPEAVYVARMEQEHKFFQGLSHPNLLRVVRHDEENLRLVFEDVQCS